MKSLLPRGYIQVHNTLSNTSRFHPTTFTSVNILKPWHIRRNNTREPISNRKLYILRICYKPGRDKPPNLTWAPCFYMDINIKKTNCREAATTEARVQFQTNPCEICGAQFVIGRDFSSIMSFSLSVSSTPPMLRTDSFIYRWRYVP